MVSENKLNHPQSFSQLNHEGWTTHRIKKQNTRELGVVRGVKLWKGSPQSLAVDDTDIFIL